MTKSPVLIAGAAIAAVAIVGGGIAVTTSGHHGRSMTAKNPTNAPATNTVSIKNFTFSPMAITVLVGTSVGWTNQDPVHHTITIDSGTGPTSRLIDQNGTFNYTFAKAGTYTYHCAPHPYMHGTVVVTN